MSSQLSVESNETVPKLTRLYLMSIPWVMAASCVGGIAVGPIRHTGLLWMISIVIGFILIPLRGQYKVHFPWLLWLPFYLFMGLSLTWGEMDWKNNIQLFVQMLLFPVIGIIASYIIRSEAQLERYNPLFIIGTLIIGALCVFYMIGPGQRLQVTEAGQYTGFAERPAATSMIVVASIFLAQLHKIPKTAIVMWLVCFAICLISRSRMATLILVALWIVHPQLSSIRMRLAVIAIAILMGLLAFNTSIIQERFFRKGSGFSGSGTLEDVVQGKFDSAGRFETWPSVIKKAQEKPWFGHGCGQSAPYVYSIWAPIDKPHNEYLKTLFDGGYIGLSFFVLGLIGTLVRLSWMLAKDRTRNWATSAGIMGWWGLILIAIVDNPLVYGNNFVHPLFMLVGASCGISTALAEEKSDSGVAEHSVSETDLFAHRPNLKPIMLR
jgi:O-antigen ligase